MKDIKVLIADDSVSARKKLRDCLIGLGCTTVLEVTDGQAAVDTFKLEFPDLVFMDIVIPTKTGPVALAEIMAYNPSAKVVMISSAETKSNITSAIKAGAYDFLLKPFATYQIKEILSKINEEVE